MVVNSLIQVLFPNGRVTDGVKTGTRSSDISDEINNKVVLRVIPENRDVKREFQTELGEVFGQIKTKIIGHAQNKATKAANSLHDALSKILDRHLTTNINRNLGNIIPDHYFKLGDLDADSFSKIILDQIFAHYPMCAESPDGDNFSIEEMGAGFQSNVLIALHRAAASLLNKKLILCVEEPEIHLDPNAQRETYYEWLKLSEANNDVEQIVITSHSAFIVNEAKLHEVVVVRRDEQSKTISAQLTSSYLATQNITHLKTKVLGIRNADIFFSQGVILVEGDSDAVALRGCFEKILSKSPINKKTTLSSLGAVVIDCGGMKSIPVMGRILRQLGIPYVMVYDKDFIQQATKEPEEKEFLPQLNNAFDSISDFFEDFDQIKAQVRGKLVVGKQRGYPRSLNNIFRDYGVLVLRTEHETDFIDEVTAQKVAATVGYTIQVGEDIDDTVRNLKTNHKAQIKKATGTAMVFETINDTSELPKIYRSLCSDILKALRMR